MTTPWVPGRGFVPDSSMDVRDVARGAANMGKGAVRALGFNRRSGSTPTSSSSSQQAANRFYGNNTLQASEDMQGTIGKPWAPYEELHGVGMGFDRTQYKFNNIGIGDGGGGSRRRGRNVNAGAGSEEEKQGGQGGQGEHFDPLAREFDLRPPERQLAIGTRAARTPLNAGDQPAGALNAGPRVHATYDKTPKAWPMGPQSRVEPMGELGMGQQPKTRREAGAGLGNRGRMQARTNIAHPEEGSTPASMSGGNVIDTTSREKDSSYRANLSSWHGQYGDAAASVTSNSDVASNTRRSLLSKPGGPLSAEATAYRKSL